MITLHFQIEEVSDAILPRIRCFPSDGVTKNEAMFAAALASCIHGGVYDAKLDDGSKAFPPAFESAAYHLWQEATAVLRAKEAQAAHSVQRPMLKPQTVDV